MTRDSGKSGPRNSEMKLRDYLSKLVKTSNHERHLHFPLAPLLYFVFFASTFSSFRTEDYLYTQHGWYTDGFTETDKQIFFHGVGLEKRLAHWFGVGVELQIQHIYGSDYANLGGGLMTSYRWLAFGKKQLSPYFEYGAGIFNGIREFPEEGTRFTFRLVYKIGLELTTERGNKIRVAYGHIHQSNNDLFDVNPGYDGNGISLSYSALLDR